MSFINDRKYGRSHGISIAEWRVLAHLSNGEAVSVGEITARVNLEKPRVSRAVTRLESIGLVAKAPHPRDARLVSISLTDAGRRVVGEIVPVALDLEARVLGLLTQAERAVLDRTIRKLLEGLETEAAGRARTE